MVWSEKEKRESYLVVSAEGDAMWVGGRVKTPIHCKNVKIQECKNAKNLI